MDSQSDSLGKAFVQPDEIAEGHRKFHRFRRIEWIDAEGIFESGHDDREAQRIQSRLYELQLIRQRRKHPVLFPGDLLELRRDRGLHRHLCLPSLPKDILSESMTLQWPTGTHNPARWQPSRCAKPARLPDTSNRETSVFIPIVHHLVKCTQQETAT